MVNFLRQFGERTDNDSWSFIECGELKNETEGFMIAAHDQSLPLTL